MHFLCLCCVCGCNMFLGFVRESLPSLLTTAVLLDARGRACSGLFFGHATCNCLAAKIGVRTVSGLLDVMHSWCRDSFIHAHRVRDTHTCARAHTHVRTRAHNRTSDERRWAASITSCVSGASSSSPGFESSSGSGGCIRGASASIGPLAFSAMFFRQAPVKRRSLGHITYCAICAKYAIRL